MWLAIQSATLLKVQPVETGFGSVVNEANYLFETKCENEKVA
jgi:hypothetical protein